MKTFNIYATETVVYETKEIKAKTLQEACSKYTDLWADSDREPQIVDSNSFETGVEEEL